MPVIKTFRDSIRLLGTKRFGTFWFASLLSSIGTWAQQVAEPWLLLSLRASSFLIGLDSFAMNAPVWLLTLLGGVLADRSDRRRVIALFQSIQMLCPAAVVLLLVFGTVKPWMIIALSVIVGVTDALSMPSFQSIVPSIVARDQIDRGLALNSTQFNLSRILGPSIAGVLMSSVGVVACFAISAVSFIPFIGVALWILPKWIAPVSTELKRTRRNPFAGIRTLLAQRELRVALLTVLTTGVLCSPLVTFCPVIVQQVFHGGAARFSITVAAFGIGGLLGGTGLLAVASSVDRRRLSSAFAIAFGALLIAAALDPWFWVLPVLLVLAGAAMTVSNTAANTLLQTTVEQAQLGQAVSLYMLAIRGGVSLGALFTGIAVSCFGVRYAILANGVLAVVLQIVFARMWFAAPVRTTSS